MKLHQAVVIVGLAAGALGTASTVRAEGAVADNGASGVNLASDPPLNTTEPEVAPSKSGKAPAVVQYLAILPEGKTLPEGVYRVRIPFRNATATSGFDSDGKKRDLGLTLKAVGSALVIEYGVTDSLSAQFLLPYVIANDVGMDAGKFRQSSLYKGKYDAFVRGVSAKLAAQGVCPDPTACAALIASGYVLPADTDVVLPSGETLHVAAGVPVKDYADALVIGAARPSAGTVGIGDLEIGGIYSLHRDEHMLVAVGLGLRFPTGKFADVAQAYRGTGRGTTDLGLRFNVDRLCGGLVVSLQNQTEHTMLKGKKSKSSVLDDTQLNKSDPTRPEAVAAGSDGKGNSQELTRAGFREVGFVRAGFNFGALEDSLKALGTSLTWNYNLDAETRYNGRALDGGAARDFNVAYAVAATGLPYEVPVDVTLTYSKAMAGRNEVLTPNILDLTFRAYLKF